MTVSLYRRAQSALCHKRSSVPPKSPRAIRAQVCGRLLKKWDVEFKAVRRKTIVLFEQGDGRCVVRRFARRMEFQQVWAHAYQFASVRLFPVACHSDNHLRARSSIPPAPPEIYSQFLGRRDRNANNGDFVPDRSFLSRVSLHDQQATTDHRTVLGL